MRRIFIFPVHSSMAGIWTRVPGGLRWRACRKHGNITSRIKNRTVIQKMILSSEHGYKFQSQQSRLIYMDTAIKPGPDSFDGVTTAHRIQAMPWEIQYGTAPQQCPITCKNYRNIASYFLLKRNGWKTCRMWSNVIWRRAPLLWKSGRCWNPIQRGWE